MKLLTALLMVTLALPAWSTDKHIPKNPLEPKPMQFDSDDNDGELLALATGAAITWWIMHRRAKRRQPEPVVVVPPSCPEPSERETRILETCLSK